MFCCRWLVLAGVLVSSSVLAADEGIPEQKLAELKAATVYVKVDGTDFGATGSGFLLRRDGETGLVGTNHHVVAAAIGRANPAKVSLVFWSGTKKEQVVPAEVLAADPIQDLAILKVSAKNLPAPLDLAQKVKPRETMTIYTFGFPLGAALSTGRGNPAVTIGKGTIGSLHEDGQGRLNRVQLDGELNPGNSGGPVVDPEGRLVGIAVSKIVGTKISFAIPSAHLTEMLMGRASTVEIRGLRVANGVAELEIDVPLIDPLQKLKTVELRHVRKDAVKEPPQPDKDGAWPDLNGAEKVALKIENGKAVGHVSVIGPEKKSFDWFFQAVYTNGEGKSVATQPLARGINFGATGAIRPRDPKSGPWETITSKEGQFTVDLPVKPSFAKSTVRRTTSGLCRVVFLGCDTPNGVYLAYRLDLPIAVPKGAEERILDAERDYFAREWEGKVASEKKVLARGNRGRDFTIRDNPKDGSGVATIRVRAYLAGRSIYMVAVVSRPDRELPDDAGRFLGSLALGTARIRATGTPEPEPTGTELKGWGLAIDPDKDCKFTPADGGLTINVPGAMHDLGGPLHKVNAPRVMREVDGDFTITVRVVGALKPGPKSTNPMSIPYLGAGILIWSDSDNFIRLERAAMLRAGRISSQIAFLEQEGGYGGAVHNVAFRENACHLRLERNGSRILGAISTDGIAWKSLKPIDTVWPERLKVGLSIVTTSSSPISVRFERFELKTKGSSTDGGK